ncbi:hypothetical protein Hanom_Chr07g00602091 [Helianthus anomalus]
MNRFANKDVRGGLGKGDSATPLPHGMSTAKGSLPLAKMMERTIQGEDAACGKEEEKVSGGAHTQINPSHVFFFLN